MQAWQSAAQLLQLHLQGQEKQPPALAFPTAKAKASIDQISKARTSRAEMEQMLQAEVRTFTVQGVVLMYKLLLLCSVHLGQHEVEQ